MSMPRDISCIALLLVVCLGACQLGPEQDRDFRSAERAIKGGSVDNTTNSIVGVRWGERICSGALVAPNLVLLARHCLAETGGLFVNCGEEQFGEGAAPEEVSVTTDPEMDPETSDFIGVEQLRAPPETDRMCGADIAMMILDESVPESTASPLVPRVNQAANVNEGYSAFGYGMTGEGENSGGAGRRRVRHRRTVQCIGTSCDSEPEVVAGEFRGTEGVCRGDSGGPAVDSSDRVIGVVSRGGFQCTTPIYVMPSAWSRWLRNVGERAAEVGGYEASAWVTEGVTTDRDGDGVLDPDDNCPRTENPDQLDWDGDGQGNACDDSPGTEPEDTGVDDAGFVDAGSSGGGHIENPYESDASLLHETGTSENFGAGNATGFEADDGGCSTAPGRRPVVPVGLVVLVLLIGRQNARRNSLYEHETAG